jgi:DNA replication protein DnaC
LHKSLLVDRNVPVQFSDTLLSDYEVTDDRGDADILDALESWSPTFKYPFILMQGDPGLGKTMLACSLLNEYQVGQFQSSSLDSQQLTVLRQQRCPVYFLRVAEWVDLNIQLIRLEKLVTSGIRDPTEYNNIDWLLEGLRTEVQMLVLDDVGKEHRTPSNYSLDLLDLLVRIRHDNGLPTIFTTNVLLRDWPVQYSESMQSLIRRSSLILEFRK